jgi:hypothetical protein
MNIDRVEVESIHGAPQGSRLVFYRCLAAGGQESVYGPVVTTDPAFDPQGYCALLLAKLNQEQSE